MPKGAHEAPPSVEAYTPISVPTYILLEFNGSITIASTGICGRPVATAVQVGVGAFKFVVFQTEATPKDERVT